MLDRDGIAALVPHQGNMCLLDAVVAWDEHHIVCEALSHTAIDNPLRVEGQLGAAAGVEYAAQAMAVHGALLAAGSKPTQGYLTSVRGLTLHLTRLDDLTGPLRISAERLSGDARLILYQFHIHHLDRCVLEGRASVVLDAQAL